MQDATTIERIRQKYLSLSPVMDERIRRQWAAAEASGIGWGGVTTVSAATGLVGKPLFMPLRKALTGLDHGPYMKKLLPLIGRERAAKRLAGEAA